MTWGKVSLDVCFTLKEMDSMGFLKASRHYKSILSLGIPVVFAQLGQIFVGIADNMMIGNMKGGGTTELAAASFANTIFTLAILFGTGFSYIQTPFVGEALGRGREKSISKLFASSTIANCFVAVVLIVLLLTTSAFMHSMGQPDEIVGLAKEYLYILIASILPMMLFFSFKQYAEGIGNTKVSMVIMIVANGINVLVNYLLIYGNFGFPELGLVGAGIGTLLSRLFMAIASAFWFYRDQVLSRFLPRSSEWGISKEDLLPFFKLGVSSGGQIVMESSAFAISAVMVGWIGTTSLAAHQIAMSISTLGFMVYQGIGSATTIRMSQLKGEQDAKGIRDTMSASLQIILLMVAVISVFFYVSRYWLPSLYTNDVEVVGMAASFIVVLAIYQLPDALMLQYGFALRGLSDVTIPALITFVSLFAVCLTVSYVSAFVFHFDGLGIWFGFPAGLSVGAVLLFFRFRMVYKRLTV